MLVHLRLLPPPPPIFIKVVKVEKPVKPKKTVIKLNKACAVTVTTLPQTSYYTCSGSGSSVTTMSYTYNGSCSRTADNCTAAFQLANDCAIKDEEANKVAARENAATGCPANTVDFFVDF